MPILISILLFSVEQEWKLRKLQIFLMQNAYAADALHGDLSQAQRDTVMKKFRLKNIDILVATDVAVRGLDVNSLTHVIHYSLPDDPEVFVHRSGRTGRAGKDGISDVFN